jgi:hypothetical protein
MDAAEMMKMNEIHQQAWNVRQGLMPKVPSPKSMMDAYRPMTFNRLQSPNGEFIIQPNKSTCFDVTNMRHALMFGAPQFKVNYGREVQFHKLIKLEGKGLPREKGKNVLTSDAPIEIYTQWLAFSKAKGNILVGGLGLGMAPTMMLGMPGVKSVTVIEKEPEIIKMVQPQLDQRIKVVQADLYEYLKILGEHKWAYPKFDFAYHDIWYSTDEGTWASDVVPLYRLTQKAGIKKMGAWGEHEMRWQLAEALYVRTCIDEKYSHWKPYQVFINGVKKALGGQPPYGPERKDEITKLIKLYLGKIGTPVWEKTFDWDAAPEAKEEAA